MALSEGDDQEDEEEMKEEESVDMERLQQLLKDGKLVSNLKSDNLIFFSFSNPCQQMCQGLGVKLPYLQIKEKRKRKK